FPAHPKKPEKFLWGGRLARGSNCLKLRRAFLPTPQNQKNSCGVIEAGKMPTRQNQKNSCGVGVSPALQIVSKGLLPEV
ncbi:hypothetical protein, partial [Microseira wollei]|uniref:hypothetical protein n=1 Tax=Microseira wollei TaxID=467598 RepID=UPI001CFD8DD3